MNYEFARPVTSAQQHTNQLDPELFPFAYNILEDPQTGRKDGILKRPRTDPFIIHTQTSTEYWQKRGALVHTDGKGNDIPIHKKVRIYAVASAQHNTPVNGVCIMQSGLPIPFHRDAVVALMRGKEVTFRLQLNLGEGEATAWGCDLTEEYVIINSAYTT